MATHLAKPSYSERYRDDTHEFRHVILDKETKKIYDECIREKRKNGEDELLTEKEWREVLHLTQSSGWRHYGIYKPEPHILLFKRPRTDK
ncbi:unnamed protein product [Vitrella brassicaformis CCMP3155]|uniref:Cyclin-dependent kinases regulatory subunit n=1 Tax=Vitrella brassicaformis (strain CCMP3155) TaxID=1169540 RepID=A0A0G4F9T7_VITBC|nr:unnamed protein product [Vitrella brassicaformis CCMP3155]|eukprot:CEM09033.1 unnamed protein product [Vitrella brassicaformis CCMP3155]